MNCPCSHTPSPEAEMCPVGDGALSAGTRTREYDPESPKQNLEVIPDGPFVDILQVKTHHVIEGGTAPPLHLPETCETRPCFQHAAQMPGIVALDFVRYGRPWAHQGHMARQNVEELWEFIEARFA